MSSYLTFYLKPKEQEKPLSLMSYSRADNVYQWYRDIINPVYIGNDENNPKYTELTDEMAQSVVDAAEEKLSDSKRTLQLRIDACKELGLTEDDVDLVVSTKEYIAKLEETTKELQFIANLVSDIEYSDFEKVLINID